MHRISLFNHTYICRLFINQLHICRPPSYRQLPPSPERTLPVFLTDASRHHSVHTFLRVQWLIRVSGMLAPSAQCLQLVREGLYIGGKNNTSHSQLMRGRIISWAKSNKDPHSSHSVIIREFGSFVCKTLNIFLKGVRYQI